MLQWTRVVSINDDELQNIRTFPLPIDLKLNEAIEIEQTDAFDDCGELHFFPKQYASENKDLNISDRKLDNEAL